MVSIKFFSQLSSAIWGPPMLFLIFGGGLFFTISLKGFQFKNLSKSIWAIFKDSGGEGELSPFKSACVALAATIGTGNIIGVAAAIAVGGPGAVFWMLLATILCMPLKFAEGYLGFVTRRKRKGGLLTGAFLYFEATGKRFFSFAAPIYAFSCLMCTLLGMGTMVQSRSMTDAILSILPGAARPYDFYLQILAGLAICLCIYLCTSKGITGIGGVVAVVVPFMLIIYCTCGIAAICYNAQALKGVIEQIFKSAFTGSAAIGGFGGATVRAALSSGVSKGIFTNESGLGTSAFSAGASTGGAIGAGLAQMGVAFIDTIVVCTISALAILTSKAHIYAGTISQMSAYAFCFGGGFAFGRVVVAVSLILFSFTSAIGVFYYGKQSMRYLTGGYGMRLYQILFLSFIFAGCIYPVRTIWNIADILNGFMAFLNVPALICLVGSLKKGIFCSQRAKNSI